jgi:hypothetical protein
MQYAADNTRRACWIVHGRCEKDSLIFSPVVTFFVFCVVDKKVKKNRIGKNGLVLYVNKIYIPHYKQYDKLFFLGPNCQMLRDSLLLTALSAPLKKSVHQVR